MHHVPSKVVWQINYYDLVKYFCRRDLAPVTNETISTEGLTGISGPVLKWAPILVGLFLYFYIV